jgi:hypothetical protein
MRSFRAALMVSALVVGCLALAFGAVAAYLIARAGAPAARDHRGHQHGCARRRAALESATAEVFEVVTLPVHGVPGDARPTGALAALA